MAKKTITRLIDDLGGGTADETVEFALDGVRYTIDLSGVHAKELREVLGPYIAAGTKQSGLGRGRQLVSRPSRAENKVIREWASKNGHSLAERGRIPAQVVAAYRADLGLAA